MHIHNHIGNMSTRFNAGVRSVVPSSRPAVFYTEVRGSTQSMGIDGMAEGE